MSTKLTPRSSLEDLKKEAKRWLKALRANDGEARAHLQRTWPGAPADPGLRERARRRDRSIEKLDSEKLQPEQKLAERSKPRAKACAPGIPLNIESI